MNNSKYLLLALGLILGIWLPGTLFLANLLLAVFFSALLFNTARGLAVLFDGVRELNALLDGLPRGGEAPETATAEAAGRSTSNVCAPLRSARRRQSSATPTRGSPAPSKTGSS